MHLTASRGGPTNSQGGGSFIPFLLQPAQAANRGEYRFHDVRMPHYLKTDGYFLLILSTNAIVIQGDSLLVPMSHAFQRLHPDLDRIKIPFPLRWAGKTIKEVRILPREKARFFTVQFVYEASEEPPSIRSKDKALAIDLGLDNLATCATVPMDRRSFSTENT